LCATRKTTHKRRWPERILLCNLLSTRIIAGSDIVYTREMGETGSYLQGVLSLSVETNMRPAPPTVSALDVTSTVMDLMAKENVGSIVVVENSQPVGIVTEKDMLYRVLKAGKNLELTLVKDVMSKPLVTIDAKRTIADALETMHRHNIRRLIVTKAGVLVGLTTERRLLEIAHGHYVMKGFDPVETTDGYEVHRIRVAYVSTYPPRECGIATYTKNLVDAISAFCTRVVRPPVVAAINDRGGLYNYEIRVKSQIDANDIQSYTKVAQDINASDVDVVNLQHEYGIFGGEWGAYVNEFLQRIEKPVITTLHTVLEEPGSDARRVMEGILEQSDFVIVMAKVGIGILEQLYGSYPDRIRHIPHGCPNVPYLGTAMAKRNLGLKDHAVLSTFGLLSRGKGIEYAIEALPRVLKDNPKILYLIIGETHPEIRKREGEEYRQFLLDLVESLGLEKNVRFVNRFLPENELINYLQASDIYVIPYPNREQISSGTLTYALSTGKAIVTTPFLHAEEAISNGAAMECGFKDPDSIAECVNTLLRDNQIHDRLGRTAYEYSRAMIWPTVAMRHVNVFYHALGL
jgi:glycosyltransferase involved in cell wall biosynthesis/CBS domain-containing protein